MLPDVLFVAGIALATVGLGMFSVPLAMFIAGAGLIAAALRLHVYEQMGNRDEQ